MDLSKLLDSKGFVEIAEVKYGLPFLIYWHPDQQFELQVAELLDQYMIKGLKKYYIKGVSEKGRETWERNLGRLMDKLKVSFPEFHLYVAGLSNISAELFPQGKKQGEQNKELEATEDQIRDLREKLQGMSNVKSAGRLFGNQLLGKVANEGAKKVKRKIQELSERGKKLEESIRENHRLVKEYEQKGTATCYVIACSTQVRVGDEDEIEVLIDETIKDIRTAHTYGGFTQSLDRGLNIYHEEVKFPWLTHQAEFVGITSPDLLEDYETLKKQARSFFMVTASEDIKVEGKIKKKGKKTPAKVLKSFLDRVETISEEAPEFGEVPTKGGWVGNLMKGDKLTEVPFLFDLDSLNHGYCSGTTGSGKTYTARVLIENAIIEGINVVILDTTRQWSGLATPASGVSKRLKKMGVEKSLATGFPIDIYTPDSSAGKELPENLSSLADGVSVVALKGLYDSEKCEIAKDLLSEAYYGSVEEEAESLETLVVIEEAHTFLPGNVDKSAKDPAKECERIIERIARETRKYGLNLLLISQSLSDFRRSSKTVREMMNSKFFMRATDRSEIGYVEDYVSKKAGNWVRNLDVGELLVTSPGISPAKVFVRPPFSQVKELSDSEIEKVMRRQEDKSKGTGRSEFLAKVANLKEGKVSKKSREIGDLSEEERNLLQVAQEYLREKDEPIYVSKAQEKLGINNKRAMQELVDQMEEKEIIKTKRLKKRGSPRGIIPQ